MKPLTLPPPLFEGQGWPYDQSLPLVRWKDTTHRISIITPSFNQGRYLEQTIRSVLLQQYPNLEYIVVDGGSSDQSVQVLEYYDRWLSYWVSEPDGGQSMAINKGLRQSTGSIVAYLNSDDYYLPGAFHAVLSTFAERPEHDLIYGRCQFVDYEGGLLSEHLGSIRSFDDIIDLWDVWWQRRQLVQPEVFWTRRIMDKIGLLNERLHYGMDYDYWTRILRNGALISSVDYPVAAFRFHASQKSTAAQKAAEELLAIVQPYLWERDAAIPWCRRLKLQGRWLYSRYFLPQVVQSLASNQGRFARYFTLGKVVLAFPQIMLEPGFQSRLLNVLKRRSNRDPKNSSMGYSGQVAGKEDGTPNRRTAITVRGERDPSK
jgi:glycosyltransferase involved in cell wall biosynthesis